MTREIPLSRGLVVVVDDADYDAIVAAGKWYAEPGRDTFYAARKSSRRDGKQRTIRMHMLLTGWPFVDHVDGNGLNNRRSNLRAADNSQNQMNARVSSRNTSGFKGVNRLGPLWLARIKAGDRRINLGTFDTPRDAARAYDEAALHYFKEFARPNFREEIGA